jgi:hypothetical protein
VDYYYVSREFERIINKIRETTVFKTLQNNFAKELLNTKLIRMIDFLLPDYSLEIFTLILYALPKQVIYQMKAREITSNEKEV